MLVPKEELYGTKHSFKYFFGDNDNDIISPLCVRLREMAVYARKYEFNLIFFLKLAINNC